MARHTLYAVPGTWEAVAAARAGQNIGPGTPHGLLRAVTDNLDPAIFDVVYVNYPQSFGPISGGGADPLAMLGNPSYRDSRDAGVAELKRLIRSRPGTFGIIGYSQGGAITSIVGQALLTGDLQSRKNDCKWLHAFASPHRAPGKTFHQGNTLGGQGISGEPCGGFGISGPIDWFDYCLPGDIYGEANLSGTYLALGYEIAIDLTLSEPVEMVAAILESLTGGELAQAIQGLGQNPLQVITRTAATAAALVPFLLSGVHGRYHFNQIRPGLTPVAHSRNHLAYWGPRI